MGLLSEIQSLLQELTPQNWITVAGFFSTPAIVVWVWPTLRGFFVAVGSTAACWLFGAIWNGASFSTILIWTPVIAIFCALLCAAVILVRQMFPVHEPAKENGATDSSPK
jgi:hypothetical protein